MTTRRTIVWPILALLCALGTIVARAQPVGTPSWVDDLSPISPEDWNASRAAHLLERAGFGAPPEVVERYAVMTPEQAVAALVDYDVIDTSRLAPFEESYVWDDGMDPFPESAEEAARRARETGAALGVAAGPPGAPDRLQDVVDKYFYGTSANAIEVQRLATWWFRRMLSTPRPLEEKLTLFWHGHFATRASAVRDVRRMERQNQLFRELASGAFGPLLAEAVRDPALLVSLGNQKNTNGHPDESFARALLDHFTLGIGVASARDVRETARAFTGWTAAGVDFSMELEQHDDGPKTVLGRTGPMDGEDVVEILLEHPATAEFVASRLYRYFVRDEVSSRMRTALGTVYRSSRYQLKPLLRRMFLSKDFYSDASVGTQVKSPVALLVSTYRKLGLVDLPTVPDVHSLATSLGQTLFEPPSTAGWPGGEQWLTANARDARIDMARGLFSPDMKSFRPPDRTMPAAEASIGARLAKGMSIAEATSDAPRAGGSASAAMDNAEFNAAYARYRGYVLALERTTPIPRRPLAIDVVELLRRARVTTVSGAVDHLIRRFLRTTLDTAERDALVSRLREHIGSDVLEPRPEHEAALREVLILILSRPEYQRG